MIWRLANVFLIRYVSSLVENSWEITCAVKTQRTALSYHFNWYSRMKPRMKCLMTLPFFKSLCIIVKIALLQVSNTYSSWKQFTSPNDVRTGTISHSKKICEINPFLKSIFYKKTLKNLVEAKIYTKLLPVQNWAAYSRLSLYYESLK